MKRIYLPFIFLLIQSCTSDQTELNRLKIENENLKSQLEEILKEKANLKEAIAVYPYSNTLELGDTFQALVFQVYQDMNELTELEVHWKKKSSETSDSTQFIFKNKSLILPEISYVPRDTGHYELEGNFKQTVLGVEYQFPFSAEFKVK